MEKNIPIKSIEIKYKDISKTVEVYEWFTEDEEAQYQSILLSGNSIDANRGEEQQVLITAESLNNAKKYLVTNLCKGLSWEDVNEWNPILRGKLFDKLAEVRNSFLAE